MGLAPGAEVALGGQVRPAGGRAPLWLPFCDSSRVLEPFSPRLQTLGWPAALPKVTQCLAPSVHGKGSVDQETGPWLHVPWFWQTRLSSRPGCTLGP